MRRNLITVLCLISIFTFSNLFAQHSSFHSCVTPHWLSDIGLQKKVWAEQYAKVLTEDEDTSTLYVDVVFHVVWHSEEERIAEAQIRQQLEDLNKAFNEVSENDIREIFHSRVAIPKIKFRLAPIDPEGNPTSGVTYTQTDIEQFLPHDLFDMDIFALIELIGSLGDLSGDGLTEFLLVLLNPFAGTDDIKKTDEGGIDPWDTERYMNIWVGDVAIDGLIWQMFGQVGDVLGYAKPPADAPYFSAIDTSGVFESLIDGIVLNYKVCGANNPSMPSIFAGKADEGKTLAHEVGHYLGLPHIWGLDGCDSDDLFEDTPTANGASPFDCEVGKNSCSNDADDHPDMIENYMDYSSDACKQMFTKEQVGMMRTMLKNSRSGLLQGEMVVGIEDELAATSSFNVYPNPSNGMIWLQNINNFSLPFATMKVYNLIGQQVLEQTIEGEKEVVDLSGLEKGTYLVQVLKENQWSSERIVLY